MAKTTNPKSIFYGDAIVNSYDDSRKSIAVDIEGNSYKILNASSTTLVSNAKGVLHAIAVGTKGGTVDVYDSLTGTGTLIAKISATFEGTLILDVAYSTGLTIVTGSTVSATAIFRPFTLVASSGSLSPSASASSSGSPSSSPSASGSPSGSPSASPSLSPSRSGSPSSSPSKSASPSASSSPSKSSSPSLSPSASLSPSW